MNTSVGHTLKVASGILAVLLVVSVALVAQESAWGGNKVTSTWDGIKDTFDDSYVIDALVEEALAEQPDKTVFKYVMSPGDYVADSSVLADFFPTEVDTFVFILVGNGDWYMEIKDCWPTGDTMIGVGKVAGQKVFGKATSPEILKLGPISVENFAIGIVLVGYIKPHTGVFPSNYNFYVWF